MKQHASGKFGLWFSASDPSDHLPVEILAPDGRGCCVRCDGISIRAELIRLPHGLICPVCAVEE